ncbi:MAG TPA: metal-dependent transcriptional regulator [Candidatus Eubacterium avistercoris]|uniref:Metal-dependent transcriptional regulator n=1 Tax=Candidatus Eubacterium avistercoris TaxID=2838567 RepID=A0A9D2D1P3_9FIRM|nr:metal-dependent transcriptional regulator [Candidatus Eubacterium avistercoris]
MEIHESAEDYLECILKLSKEKPVVRSIDIAVEMNYSKPSISVAMKNLRLNGLITVDKNGFITLTEEGRKIAENIYERHLLLTEWLVWLGVDQEIAAGDACRIEHDLSPESYEALKHHVLTEIKGKRED